MDTIRIGEDHITFTPGLASAVRLMALAALHAGARVTWPDGTANWHEQRTDGLWLHTRQPNGLTSMQRVS